MSHNTHYFERSAGVLLPVSSLPSRYGIGDFGEKAREWIDFLHEAKQSYWQILPLNPPDDTGSPYQSVSAFAGSANYIDLDALREDGLLNDTDFSGIEWNHPDNRVRFESTLKLREQLVCKAYTRFDDKNSLDEFAINNRWFEYYALYMVIREARGGRSWVEWEESLRAGDTQALDGIREEYRSEIRRHAFIQYQFNKQWHSLREYANAKNIRIIGDIPIYISLDSADAWSNPGLFRLNGSNCPDEVAGYPPDALSDYGQLWGNPVYDWDVIADTGFHWWIERLRHNFTFYDVLRLDHFRGFESYYSIPYGSAPAAGRWIKGPGNAFIDAVKRAIPSGRFIAEDLGAPSDDVDKLLRYSGFPGMKVLQFAFDPLGDRDNRPYKYSPDTVVYPGTHDNDTVKGWAGNTPDLYIDHAMEYMDLHNRGDLPRGMIREAMRSGADLAIIPFQDWLGSGNEARINTPSTVGPQNWSWRLENGSLSGALAEEMAKMTVVYDRNRLQASRE